MKKVSNKQIAQTFRNAMSRLDKRGTDESKHIYICFAITDSAIANGTSWEARVAAKKVITDRIAPHSSLDFWLLRRGVPEKQLENPTTWNPTRRLQQHRHAWLQQLIKEFENKPD